LWRSCLKNDRSAQYFLYQKFAPTVFGICLRYAKNKSAAEDLLQEAFLKVFQKIDQYQERGPLGAWIAKIAVYVCLEAYRKDKTRQRHEDQYGALLEDDHSFDSVLDRLALEDLVEKIQSLPLTYRTIFNLYAIEGYSHVEIAELLQIPVGTSKGQYSRAKDLLRKSIEIDEKFEKANYETR
jgi:RNA polymerase sigma-70 factor (ECF subfamily)